MRLVAAICLLLFGCGSVAPGLRDADADTAMGGTGGAGGIGGAANAGQDGGGGTGGNAGAAGNGVACAAGQNTRSDCRDLGTALVTAYVNCKDAGFAADPTWGQCSTDGKIASGDYAGLICPFDVGAEIYPGPANPAASCAAVECIGSIGIPDDVVWYAWRNTADTIYCCDGLVVRKMPRCR